MTPREKPIDRRLFLDQSRNLLFVLNLKCGYSSFNHFFKDYDIEIEHLSCLSDKKINSDTKTIFFVRDPLKRFHSFYSNWVVNQELNDSYKNRYLYNLFARTLSEPLMKKLIAAPKEEKATEECFLDFVEQYIGAKEQDRHSASQTEIYESHGKDLSFFSHIYNYRQNREVIKELYGKSLTVTNVSRTKKAKTFNTKESDEIIVKAYARDYELLKQWC